jgi:hypothetical protein
MANVGGGLFRLMPPPHEIRWMMVHLDRKLERMLVMLFKLQELRRAANPT